MTSVTGTDGLFDVNKYDAIIKANGGTPSFDLAEYYVAINPELDKYMAETKQATDEWQTPDILKTDPLNATLLDTVLAETYAGVGSMGTFEEPDDKFASTAMATTTTAAGTADANGIITFTDDSIYTKTYDPATKIFTFNLKDGSNTEPAEIDLGMIAGDDGTITYDATSGLIKLSDGSYFIPATGTLVASNAAINAGSKYKVQNYETGELMTRAGVYTEDSTDVSNLHETVSDEEKSTINDYLLKAVQDYTNYSDEEAKSLTATISQYYSDIVAKNGSLTVGAFQKLVYGAASLLTGMKNSSNPDAVKYFGGSTLPYDANTLSDTGVYGAWNNGYTGKGMVVAVIDNGLETDPDLRLTDESSAAITEEQAKAIIAKLGYGTYVNSKIPFAFSYADNDSDNTGTYEVDHGEHVAGIIGANGIVPATKDAASDLTDGLSSMIGALAGGSIASPTFEIKAKDIDQLMQIYRDALGDSPEADAVLVQLYQEAEKNAKISAETAAANSAKSASSDDATGTTGTGATTEAISTSPLFAEFKEELANYLEASAASTEDYSAAETLTKADSGYDVGIAPEAQILDMRVISNNVLTQADAIAHAIRDAADMGADVINMSIGGAYLNEEEYNLEEEAIAYARDKGVVVVVAASNSGTRANTGDGNGTDYTPENYSQLSNPATSPFALAVAAQGDISTKGMMSTMFGVGDSSQIAQFSSWGPNSDFSLKPDLAADGVQVDSLEYEDQDQSMSGTSMASPVAAGVATLVLQHFKELNTKYSWGLTPAQLVDLTREAMMNSATVLHDAGEATPDSAAATNAAATGVAYAISPRSQGAGGVDAGAATSQTVVAAGAQSGTGSISLYSVGQSTDFEINFTNYGDTDVTYTFTPTSDTVLMSAFETDADGHTLPTGFSHDYALAGGQVTTGTTTFTVKAGATVQITMNLAFDANTKKNQIVEGYLEFLNDAADGTNNITLPYLGFYGDLTDENVFDVTGAGYTAYLEDGASQLPLGIGSTDESVKELVAQGDTNFANDGDTNPADDAHVGAALAADASKAAISPNADGDNDTATPVVFTTQNLKSIKAEIVDASGNVVRTIDNETDLDASGLAAMSSVGNSYSDLANSYSMYYHNDALNWDGLIYDQTTGKMVAAPDGVYKYKITATLNYEGANKEQTKEFAITVDTVKPTIENAALDVSTFTVAAGYSDDRSGFTKNSQLTYNIGGKEYTTSLGNDGTALSGNVSYKLTDTDLTNLKNSDGKIILTIHDVAGNAATFTVQTPFGNGAASTTESDPETQAAPTFQFYAQDTANVNGDYSDIKGFSPAAYGFTDIDAYSALEAESVSDTATLKAHVTGKNAQAFIRNDLTGEVINPDHTVATADGGYDAYFKVSGLNATEALMINLGAAVFAGYSIAPTDDAGTYKQSLVDGLMIMAGMGSAGESVDTEFVDSTVISPFTDPATLKAAIDKLGHDSLGNIPYDPTWEVGSGEVGYNDSHFTANFYKDLVSDIAKDRRTKGHTIDVNHTHANNHDNTGSAYDYSADTQDILKFTNPADGAEVRLTTTTTNPDYDATTGVYTIKGHVETANSAYEGKITNAKLYILGASTYEDDPANAVTLDAAGNFEYKVILAPDAIRDVSYILTYQLINDDGNTGELRVVNGSLSFETDAEDPTLNLNIPGVDTGAPTADGTYTLYTTKTSLDLSAIVDDNAPDYTLTVNGSQVFRQKTYEEALQYTDSQEFGAYTYSKNIPLNQGDNYITVVATDDMGNMVTKIVKVVVLMDPTYAPTTAPTTAATSTSTDDALTLTVGTGATSPDTKAATAKTATKAAKAAAPAKATPFVKTATIAAPTATHKRDTQVAARQAGTNGATGTGSVKTVAFGGSKAKTTGTVATEHDVPTNALPQTGDANDGTMTVVGAMALAATAVLAFFGLAKKNRID